MTAVATHQRSATRIGPPPEGGETRRFLASPSEFSTSFHPKITLPTNESDSHLAESALYKMHGVMNRTSRLLASFPLTLPLSLRESEETPAEFQLMGRGKAGLLVSIHEERAGKVCRGRASLARRYGIALLLLLTTALAPACGPFFPNTLLDGGDRALLVAPLALFDQEIQRLLSAPPPANSGLSSPGKDTVTVAAADLQAALQKTGMPLEQLTNLVNRYSQERTRLLKIEPKEAKAEEPKEEATEPAEAPSVPSVPSAPPPAPPPAVGISAVTTHPPIEVISGLPGEFADYLRGAGAWRNSDREGAVAAWKTLLERPEAERPYRSTWATYMLGRALHDTDPTAARRYYQKVRDLARQGFSDSLNLSAASIGWEAQTYYKKKEYARAIELYLAQAAAGDRSALVSLRWSASGALAVGGDPLQALAAHPQARRVITAYLIAQGRIESGPGVANEGDEPVEKEQEPPAVKWLEAMETAGVKEVDLAEQLALAAYQNSRMDLAQRWINRAPASPATQWLQAKLFLYAGKVDAAAALLSKVARQLPLPDTAVRREPAARAKTAGPEKPASPAKPPLPGFAQALYVPDQEHDNISSARQVHGELGAFHLARREYLQALDALLRSGFWHDAAYVAERVLTQQELRDYVDNQWPPASQEEAARLKNHRAKERAGWNIAKDGPLPDLGDISPAVQREKIRYLLARRMARINRGNEARAYYPEQWQPVFDEMFQNMALGENLNLPAEPRAAAWWKAAGIARTNGLELLGTEVEPDWAIYGGDFEGGISTRGRAAQVESNSVTASTEELRRGEDHAANPDQRFHYRYLAAGLAMDAARLMPNNSEETARLLCIAGSWLKYRDPQTADLFYKTLVRRCRKTVIGAEADRRRWFPPLDANGNLIPRSPAPPPAEPPAEPPINNGDTPVPPPMQPE